MKKYLFILVFSALILVTGFVLLLNNLSRIVVIRGDDFHYLLQPGATAQDFVSDLDHYANFRLPLIMRFFIRWKGVGTHLLAGEYLFPHGSTIGNVVNRVVSGDVVYHPLTIIDGWNAAKVKSAIDNAPFIQHTLVGLTSKQIAEKLGMPFDSFEGTISPNTYYYTWGASDFEILKMAYKAMMQHLEDSWFNRDENLPYKNIYQALIVSSILEKEASLPSERRLIAGVIINRLRKHMKLQMDSTVIYGLGKQFNGDLTKADLRHNTPYNTYVHYGLPPTPIAMPSFDAVDAALHPAATDALYFVSKNDGTHVFSNTLTEQNRAVEKYQLSE